MPSSHRLEYVWRWAQPWDTEQMTSQCSPDSVPKPMYPQPSIYLSCKEDRSTKEREGDKTSFPFPGLLSCLWQYLSYPFTSPGARSGANLHGYEVPGMGLAADFPVIGQQAVLTRKGHKTDPCLCHREIAGKSVTCRSEGRLYNRNYCSKESIQKVQEEISVILSIQSEL